MKPGERLARGELSPAFGFRPNRHREGGFENVEAWFVSEVRVSSKERHFG